MSWQESICGTEDWGIVCGRSERGWSDHVNMGCILLVKVWRWVAGDMRTLISIILLMYLLFIIVKNDYH